MKFNLAAARTSRNWGPHRCCGGVRFYLDLLSVLFFIGVAMLRGFLDLPLLPDGVRVHQQQRGDSQKVPPGAQKNRLNSEGPVVRGTTPYWRPCQLRGWCGTRVLADFRAGVSVVGGILCDHAA